MNLSSELEFDDPFDLTQTSSSDDLTVLNVFRVAWKNA
jgi:hypothetical protein